MAGARDITRRACPTCFGQAVATFTLNSITARVPIHQSRQPHLLVAMISLSYLLYSLDKYRSLVHWETLITVHIQSLGVTFIVHAVAYILLITQT
jgi:hypothetical protein